MFYNNETLFNFVSRYGLITAQRYKKGIKKRTKTMYAFTVRLKGEVQGRYNTYQVAMNHAQDLVEELGGVYGFSPNMVEINFKPFNYWFGY